MIDLHCHVLPKLDDGPADMESSVRMAQVAVDDGIHTLVATPHVNLRCCTELEVIGFQIGELRAALARNEVPISVVAGAEIGLSRLPGLGDEQLRALCLGDSSYVLVESPYGATGSLIEESIFDLQVRGFRPVLAHPERCPEFQRETQRLERLVETGVPCSISAGSINGQFGEPVRRFAFSLLARGLVHNVASDGHDPVRRAPRIRGALRVQKGPLANPDLQLWLTSAVPAAMLADEPLPPRPPVSGPSRWRRMYARRRAA